MSFKVQVLATQIRNCMFSEALEMIRIYFVIAWILQSVFIINDAKRVAITHHGCNTHKLKLFFILLLTNGNKFELSHETHTFLCSRFLWFRFRHICKLFTSLLRERFCSCKYIYVYIYVSVCVYVLYVYICCRDRLIETAGK